MPRVPGNPDRDFLASQIKDDIVELFASPPPEIDEFFGDPIVRMRIGMLITEAMSEPTMPKRMSKSSKPRLPR
jgi:hypothetical protein